MYLKKYRGSYLDCTRGAFSEDFCNQLFEKIWNLEWWVELRSYRTLFLVELGCNCFYKYGSYCVQSRNMSAFICEFTGLIALRVGMPYAEAPNSVNINHYKEGKNAVGFHSDDEALFYSQTNTKREAITIVGLSLESSRRFLVRTWILVSCIVRFKRENLYC